MEAKNKILDRMCVLRRKYKSVIFYITFGVLTTIINLVLYWLFYDVLKVSNILSNIIAWFGAISVAFLTNKNLVFGSSSWERKTVLREFAKFIVARLATGGVDLLFMFVTVDLLGWNGLIMKMLANVIVIILNYILSRLVVFKNKPSRE